jgi:hypothetical protein
MDRQSYIVSDSPLLLPVNPKTKKTKDQLQLILQILTPFILIGGITAIIILN